jgi:signal transduction histidine kinase
MNVYHIIEAVGLLVVGLVFYSYVYDWAPPTDVARRLWRAALLGAGFGGITVALMIARIEVGAGTYIDARVVPVALIGLFEGWPAALLAALFGAGYRIYLGGRGMVPGVAALLATAAVAGLAHVWMRRDGRLRVRHVVVLTGASYAIAFVSFLALDLVDWMAHPAAGGTPGLVMFERVWLSYLVTVAAGIAGLSRLFHDVVEQRRLTAERQRFRAIVDETTDAIRIVDPRTHVILDANRADGELSGAAPSAIVGQDDRPFWPPAEDPSAWQAPDARGIARAQGVPFRPASGAAVAVDATRHRVAYQGRAYDIVVFRAAADRLAAEEALREAAELRTAGLLARAAAHEINNPLAVILGYLQMLGPRVAADVKLTEWTAHMKQAAARIGDAVVRLNRIVKIETTATSGSGVVMLDTEKSSAPARPSDPAPPPQV